jgi:PAS domain S-box-containing protein
MSGTKAGRKARGAGRPESRVRGVRRSLRPRDDPADAAASADARLPGHSSDVTERREGELLSRALDAINDLKQRVETFAKAFRFSPHLMAISTIDEGRVLDMNRSALKALGYRRQEVIGKTTVELGIYRDYRIRQAMVRALRQRGYVRNLDVALRDRDGNTLQGIYSGAIITVKGRRVLLSVLTDVTERRRMEEALRESEEKYRRLVEVCPDAIFINRGNKLVFINKAGLRLFGAKRAEQMLGRSPFEFTHRAYHAVVRKRIRQQLRTGRAIPAIEERIYRLDGTLVDVEVTATPFRYGGEWAIQAVLRDITERKAAERALREGETRLRLAMENGRLGTWDWNLVTNRITWNAREFEMFGLPFRNGTVDPADVARQYDPKDVPEIRRRLGAAMKLGSDFDHAGRVRQPDGTVRWIHSRGRPIRGADGKPVRLIGMSIDVTAERVAEEALRKDRNELERRVEERTADLLRLNEALEQEIARRRRVELQVLEAAEREQQRIGRDLHDGLCQVLAGLTFGTHVLHGQLERRKAPEAGDAAVIRDHLRAAIAQARGLAAALHPVQPEPNGLMAGLKTFSTTVKDLFKVDCRFDCRQSVLVGDPTVATHLYRIAQEAVHNAVRHGGAKEIRIALRRDARALSLCVADNGRGFSSPTKRARGIGLDAMRYRAEAIGGECRIESSPRRGATVTCRVPLPLRVGRVAP